jgi:hypothetical protein
MPAVHSKLVNSNNNCCPACGCQLQVLIRADGAAYLKVRPFVVCGPRHSPNLAYSVIVPTRMRNRITSTSRPTKQPRRRLPYSPPPPLQKKSASTERAIRNASMLTAR